jgi:hypothetical protein
MTAKTTFTSLTGLLNFAVFFVWFIPRNLPGLTVLLAVIATTMPSIANAKTMFVDHNTEMPTAPASITADMLEASRRFKIPVLWLQAVMQVESAGNAQAVSPKGAMGLMQIMPETYAELRQEYRLGADPFNPHNNILAGAAYLHTMYERFGTPGFLAAYNAGPAQFAAHLATGEPLPDETQNYLAMVEPLIDGVLPLNQSTPSDPLAWIHAPLFITPGRNSGFLHADGESNAPAVNENSPNQFPFSSAQKPSDSTLAPQSAGMFVPSSSKRGQ